jgi:tripartite-type tricarboxylate transporter receptor subunit TctC
MTSRISFWVSPIATVLAQINAGQVRALAAASESRLPDIPNVPTIKEAGFGDFDASTTYAFFAPAGTSAETLDILTKSVSRAIDDPDVRQRIIKAGVAPTFESPDIVRALVARRVGELSELIKAAGINLDSR